MKSTPKRRAKRASKKPLLITAVALAVVLLISLWVWHRHSNPSQSIPQPATGTTSKITPHQGAPTSTSNRQGGVIDQKGQISGNLPPSSEWASSSSGNITIQQPVAGQTVQSGDTISGTAKVDTVQFILKDSSVGVISQGSMSVVDGKFSGTLEFTPHSSSGMLEVFYPNPSTGAEQDIINIDVKFNG